jgi:hypothetical protein
MVMLDIILRRHTTMRHLTIVETILRDRARFFADIRDGKQVQEKIVAMLLSCFVFLAVYGAVMGASHSILQAVTSSLKLPILFLATLAICAPSLHFFYVLFGSHQTILQTIALILTAIATTAVLLFSLAPITFFFLITNSQYPFFKLLNVIFFTMAGFLGVGFLRQGIRSVVETGDKKGASSRRSIFVIWALLYGFVGSQMAWTLSPFMGDPSLPYILARQSDSNFYADVLNSLVLLFR